MALVLVVLAHLTAQLGRARREEHVLYVAIKHARKLDLALPVGEGLRV